MEIIKPGKFVELTYDLYEVAEPQEVLMYRYTVETPDAFVYGMESGMLESFAKAINGLKVGEKFDLLFGADQAFGNYLDEYVMEFDREMFMVDGEFDAERIKVGNAIEMMTAEGHRVPGDVLEVTENKVKIDFNHPLAGQSIHFVGEVKTVRDATPEELEPKHCGCGCGDNEHGDCDCGDGCGEGCNCH
ncbi:MAG: peptidylprolyl isomerase [Muribaculaceae bacterium]